MYFKKILFNFKFYFKFYNDLTPILLKFQSKVTDFVFARKTEKDDLMKEIQTSLTRPSSSIGKPARPPPPAPTSTTDGAPQPPQQQQQPYPTNNFAAPYFPMMPNAYNPYAYSYPNQNPGQVPPPATYYPQGGAPGYPYPPQYPPQYPPK